MGNKNDNTTQTDQQQQQQQPRQTFHTPTTTNHWAMETSTMRDSFGNSSTVDKHSCNNGNDDDNKSIDLHSSFLPSFTPTGIGYESTSLPLHRN
mmetsp:Transcript_5228/g.8266  ORF Transcript_5228/g.8266 Transcript_5228/m.8266 type:complete len:94 (+) Transcript_5228:200-481(+)